MVSGRSANSSFPRGDLFHSSLVGTILIQSKRPMAGWRCPLLPLRCRFTGWAVHAKLSPCWIVLVSGFHGQLRLACWA